MKESKCLAESGVNCNEKILNTGGNTMEKEQSFREVPPIPSDDYPIVRDVAEDGIITYRHPVGHPVETDALELDMFIECMYERYQSLIALLDPDDYRAFGILFEAVNAYNMRQLHEMLEFLSRCIGTINLHYVDRTAEIYRPGRIVGLSIETQEVRDSRMRKAQG